MKTKSSFLALVRSAVFVCLAIGVLSSCKVGQDYLRPQLDLPEVFHNIPSTTDNYYSDSTSVQNNIGQLGWRVFFSDQELVNLIDTALASNFDLAEAAYQLQINRELLLQARVNQLPTLDLIGQNRREHHSEAWYSGPSARYYGDRTPPSRWFVNRQNFYVAAEASWEPDIWGRFRRETEANRAAFLQSDEMRKAVQTALVAEVATAYYNLMMLQEQLEVAESNLKLNDSTLNIVQLQYRAGQVTALAITQTETQKLIAASLIPQLKREIAIERNNLNLLLGRYPSDNILVQSELKEVRLMTNLSTGVPFELLRNRPDVYAAELALVEANARVGVAQAMRYPALNILATFGTDAMDLSNVLSPNAIFGIFIGTLAQPIFQQRRLKTRYRVAMAERDIAEVLFRKAVVNAVREVSNELASIQNMQEELEIAQARIDNSQKALRESEMLFKSGFANYLEVINAQSNALDSDLNYVSVQMQLLIANIELYRALGGGWR